MFSLTAYTCWFAGREPRACGKELADITPGRISKTPEGAFQEATVDGEHNALFDDPNLVLADRKRNEIELPMKHFVLKRA